MKEIFLCSLVFIFALISRANPVEMEFPKFPEKVKEQAKDKKDKGCKESYDKLRNEGEKACTVAEFNSDVKDKEEEAKSLAKEKYSDQTTK